MLTTNPDVKDSNILTDRNFRRWSAIFIMRLIKKVYTPLLSNYTHLLYYPHESSILCALPVNSYLLSHTALFFLKFKHSTYVSISVLWRNVCIQSSLLEPVTFEEILENRFLFYNTHYLVKSVDFSCKIFTGLYFILIWPNILLLYLITVV